MNLRDKLNAIAAAPKKPAAPQPAVPREEKRCWERTRLFPIDDLPAALTLRRDTLMLMQGEELPEGLDPRRILYLDTETTGLSGGAGTVAFLVGVGCLTDEGFEVRQLVMRDYPEEEAVLRRLRELTERFDVLCTFNGKTFDLPLLRSRFLMNRMKPDCLDKPHIDLLHLSRRLWKLRLGRCNLGRLEEAILGKPRVDDLPGSEVPERYFTYLKTGDFGLLEDVLTHNAQDIASLCVLLTRMAALYEHPEAQCHEEDVFSMGRALEKEHHAEAARRCYRLCASGKMRVQGQLRLADSWRREGELGESVTVWLRMIARREGGIRPYVEMAKYYEHRAGDIDAALDMTRKAISLLAGPTLLEDGSVQNARNALQYRYERLRRKKQRSAGKE